MFCVSRPASSCCTEMLFSLIYGIIVRCGHRMLVWPESDLVMTWNATSHWAGTLSAYEVVVKLHICTSCRSGAALVFIWGCVSRHVSPTFTFLLSVHHFYRNTSHSKNVQKQVSCFACLLWVYWVFFSFFVKSCLLEMREMRVCML